jgi:FkbM family methyltransferase
LSRLARHRLALAAALRRTARRAPGRLACSSFGAVLERPLLIAARAFPRLRIPLYRGFFHPRFERYDRVATSRLRNGLRFSARTRDFPQKQILVAGMWEPSISACIDSMLERGDVVVDVGANTGYYTLLALDKVGPEGRVIAIEPSADAFEMLGFNVDQNSLGSRAILFQCAATATAGRRRLYGFEGNSALSTLVPTESATGNEDVVGRPLDDLIDPQLRRRIKLIKIDVEGSEIEVLRGATETLAALPETGQLVVEVTVDSQGRSEPVEWLRALGFQTFLLRNRYGPLKEQMLQTSARQPEACDALPPGGADLLFKRARHRPSD